MALSPYSPTRSWAFAERQSSKGQLSPFRTPKERLSIGKHSSPINLTDQKRTKTLGELENFDHQNIISFSLDILLKEKYVIYEDLNCYTMGLSQL